jgi:hypothetical protein
MATFPSARIALAVAAMVSLAACVYPPQAGYYPVPCPASGNAATGTANLAPPDGSLIVTSSGCYAPYYAYDPYVDAYGYPYVDAYGYPYDYPYWNGAYWDGYWDYGWPYYGFAGGVFVGGRFHNRFAHGGFRGGGFRGGGFHGGGFHGGGGHGGGGGGGHGR